MSENDRKTTPVKPDALRITFKRGDRSRVKVTHKEMCIAQKKLTNKSKVKLFKCISMWKNPTSQIVPLETRVVHNRFRDIKQDINTKMFFELKSALDNAEHLCSQMKGAEEAINKDADRIEEATEVKELFRSGCYES